jgi:ABC-2 type transport system ATP-binding protein
MISLRNLSSQHNGFFLVDICLEVRDNEIYFLMNRQEQGNDLLFRVFSGSQKPDAGKILYGNGKSMTAAGAGATIFVDKIVDVADFETEARISDWIDFICRGGGLSRENILKTLLVCNVHERYLHKKVRDVPADVFKQIYLALCLAPDSPNIVCNDFIKGAEKSFEMKFNKLLLQKKAAGRAILCLSSDIFYASEIADRIGFIKNGHLLFEADAVDVKDMDIKDLYYKFLS